MNTTTQRPAHVPAPIAKVDGDTQVMQWEYLARTGQSEIDHLMRLYVYLNHKQAKLASIQDKAHTEALKAQKWITAIEGKIAEAEMSILRHFEDMEEAAILADYPVQVAEAAPVIDPAKLEIGTTVSEYGYRGVWYNKNKIGYIGDDGFTAKELTRIDGFLVADYEAEIGAIVMRWADTPALAAIEAAPEADIDNVCQLCGGACCVESDVYGLDTVCPKCGGSGIDPDYAPEPAPKSETARTDIVTRLDAVANDIIAKGRTTQAEDDCLDVMSVARAEIRRLQAVITDLQADLHECERARTATDEAFAGYVKQTEAQVATFETETEQLRGERDHYLRGLNDYARVQPWDMATSRDEAEEIGERYARAKADKFSLYAD